MSPENVCPRFKQNAWKKELCSNCFRPKEEHPEKPKRVHVDYKPLPEVSPAQSILKVNGSCEKSRNVSFSIVEFEVIGYGGEEYSTDEEYSSGDDDGENSTWFDSGDDEELKRLTEANTNLNCKLIVPNTIEVTPKSTEKSTKKTIPKSSPPLVTVQPFGEPPKSLVFNFLKNKEIVAAAAKEAVKNLEKKDATVAETTCTSSTSVAASITVATTTAEEIRLRKTETKKPSLTRSSLVANSNEPYLNIKRNSSQQSEQSEIPLEIPTVKLHPPPDTVNVEKSEEPNEGPKDDSEGVNGAATLYKTRSNVPRMGTMHFKLKLAQKPELPKSPPPPLPVEPPPTTESSLTSREMAGEPDGKADSDEPGDPMTATIITPVNLSFLHRFNNKDSSPPPLHEPNTTLPRTPLKKTSITSNGSPPECPRSIKRQAPKPPPPTPPLAKESSVVYHNAQSSLSDEELFKPIVVDEVTVTNQKLLAEYCEQIEKEQNCKEPSSLTTTVEAVEVTHEPPAVPSLPGRRPSYEKKKYGKASKMGLKIKKFLRIPSKESDLAVPQSPRPKLEIIHPLDINKSAVEIIHNAEAVLSQHQQQLQSVPKIPSSNHYTARPSKPPPPPRSLPPVLKPKYVPTDSPKTCDSSTSDETYEPVNFSAPECDHSSPEMPRLTSMQYCGSETESEIYPTIQFGDDFGAEDSIRNTQPTGHKSLEENYDAVVIANHEALTKLLNQATCDPRVPKELASLKTQSLEWSDFRVNAMSRILKAGHAFYNAKWYDTSVVLSVSARQAKLNNVLNNYFTLAKVSQFVAHVGQEFSVAGAENEQAYVTLWSAHRMESLESYCKEYNAKYADVTKEAGLVLVETITVLLGLQAADVQRYSLRPFVVTRNGFGADPTVAIVQLEDDSEEDRQDTLCEVMLKALRLLAPTWEMTVCLSQVLRQAKPNSLSKCKTLLEFWLWGPTGMTVAPDRPLSLKRWLDLERANNLHGHVCSRSTELSAQQICYMSFLVTDDDALFSDAARIMLADRKVRPPRDPTISKC